MFGHKKKLAQKKYQEFLYLDRRIFEEAETK